jgi:hypothetical protein
MFKITVKIVPKEKVFLLSKNQYAIIRRHVLVLTCNRLDELPRFITRNVLSSSVTVCC